MTDQAPTTNAFPSQLEKFTTFVAGDPNEQLLIEMFTKFREEQMEEKRKNSNVLPFGKYKYRTIKDVLAFDRKYLLWLTRQSSLDGYPETRKNIIALLE